MKSAPSCQYRPIWLRVAELVPLETSGDKVLAFVHHRLPSKSIAGQNDQP